MATDFKESFVFGLGSFLVGHIFYFIAFRSISIQVSFLNYIIRAIPYFLWGALVLVSLIYFGELGDLFLPIVIYSLTLSTVTWQSSFSNLKKISSDKNAYFFRFFQIHSATFGAALFTFSDTLIAFERFLPTQFSTSTTRMIYMTAYYLGQWAIAYSTKLE